MTAGVEDVLWFGAAVCAADEEFLMLLLHGLPVVLFFLNHDFLQRKGAVLFLFFRFKNQLQFFRLLTFVRRRKLRQSLANR